ncbi:MAG: hypothetical protein ABJ059_14850 [Hyphomicrobiales bacterium]
MAEPLPISEMLYADDAGIISRSNNSLANMVAGEDDGRYRCRVWFDRMFLNEAIYDRGSPDIF